MGHCTNNFMAHGQIRSSSSCLGGWYGETFQSTEGREMPVFGSLRADVFVLYSVSKGFGSTAVILGAFIGGLDFVISFLGATGSIFAGTGSSLSYLIPLDQS